MRNALRSLCSLAGAACLAAGCNIIAGLQPAQLIQADGGTGSATTTTTTTTTATTTTTTTAASCPAGVQEGEETDVGCGGPVCDALGKTCAFGKKCKADADCATCFCNGATCDALTLGTAQNAVGVAVDATSVYWTDAAGGIVAKAPNAGGGPSLTLAFDQAGANSIALDGNNVYWTTPGTVLSVPLNGGAPNTIASGQTGVAAIAVSPMFIYWNVRGGTGSSVMSAPLAGGQELAIASGPWFAQGIVLDTNNVYFTTAADILKAPIDSGNATPIATTDVAMAIVLNGGNVYWTGFYMNMALIATASIVGDGGAPTVLASETSTAAPLGLAVDSQNLYWTDAANGTVMKAPTGGGVPAPLATGQDTPSGIAIDQTYVYWAGGTAVKKRCK